MSLPANIDSIFSRIDAKAEDLITQLPLFYDGPIYVAAFWLFYADYENIYPPLFAQNSIAARIKHPDEAWSPAEWEQSEIEPFGGELEPLYDELMAALKTASETEWAAVIEAHFHLYCGLCRRLTEKAHTPKSQNEDTNLTHWNMSDDFVFAVIEEREGSQIYNRLVRASVTPENLSRIDGIVHTENLT